MRRHNALMTAALVAASAWMFEAPQRAQGRAEPDCHAAMTEAVAFVPVPGEPVFVASTRDGCWLFVRTLGSLSVLRREAGSLSPFGTPLTLEAGSPIVLTRDERILVARQHGQLVFLDVAKLVAGDPEPLLGAIESPRFERPTVNLPGTLLVSPDDRYLIAVQHWTAWISVVDLDHVRTHGPSPAAIVGGIPTAQLPGTIRISPDARRLYLAQAGPNGIEAPAVACQPSRPVTREAAGWLSATASIAAVSAIDLSMLPPASQGIASDIVAECSSISMAVSPTGDRLYVIAHGHDTLLVFDTSPIQTAKPPELVGSVPVARGPRDVVVSDDGTTVFVAHGNIGSFVSNAPNVLTVIDAASVSTGAAAVRGVIPTRSQVISLTVSADGRTLFAPNRFDQTLQVIDLDRLSLETAPPLPGVR